MTICSSINCASYCYSYGCSSIHRAARPSYTYNFPAPTDIVTAEFTNALRTAIQSELTARRIGRNVASTTIVAGVSGPDVAYQGDVKILDDLKACINAMSPNAIKTEYTGEIKLSHVTEIRDAIQALLRSCVCNSDCGANAFCSCYGDCGCFYSDKRVKREIETVTLDTVL